ncbi:MAG: HIT family protein [Lysobacterales bacterium]
MKSFELDPSLRRDTHSVCETTLSSVLLMNDARFPWLILVPRIVGARDLIDLDTSQCTQLMDEIALASRALKTLFAPHKLNVAALGNVVEQLHVHVIARFRTDGAWPRPVWGVGMAEPYTSEQLAAILSRLRESTMLL